MFANGIAFVCFYDVERVLSAIAKFFVHFLGTGRSVVKWEDRQELGKRDRRGGENMEVIEVENIPRKCNIFGIWERPLGGYMGATAPCHTNSMYLY